MRRKSYRPTALRPADTFCRVRSACCDESTIDVDMHAMYVTRLAIEARAAGRRAVVKHERRAL